jgi:protein involved in polysaccharide export with SLBB domain
MTYRNEKCLKNPVIMILYRPVLLVILFLSSVVASAQVITDVSQIKVSQISDAQLKQYLQQATDRGLTDQQIEAELLRRGMPASELDELRLRVQKIRQSDGATVSADTTTSSYSGSTGGKRLYSRQPLQSDLLFSDKKTSRIFGAELFSKAGLSFEPDMRMATPKDYVIGPDDQLILNVYGVNLSQQNLRVSPEGTVNVKYAGIVSVGGLTIEGAAALLRSRLSRFYPSLANGQTKLELSLGNIKSIQVILIGAITRPGTYTLPSLATLFNALYVSGGPTENGSLRNIELIRNNKVIAVADLYDFLIRGIQTGNVHLQHNDVIRVPYASLLVTLDGQLNRPGIFELKPDETLADAIQYAGSFKSQAFRGRITGRRVADFERSVIDVPGDSLAFFNPQNGDEFVVDSIINRYQNRIIISGAVLKPGAYALQPSMTVKDLIDKARGLKEDVYDGRAILVRTRADLTKEYISVDLKPLLMGEKTGLLLQKEDSLHVASIFDLRDTTTVTINGAIRRPGDYRFEDNLSLKSLIMKAQGFTDNATGTGIEISRRKRDVQNQPGSDIVELIKVNSDKDLSGDATDVILKPFDIVTIKEDPYYKKQISVKVSGEVLMPSVYTLRSREERLSSLIARSGGLLYTANIKGAKLIRQKKDEVVDTSEIRRLFMSLKKDTTSSPVIEQVKKNTSEVAIDLVFILKHPGSEDDITLEEGDELVIPRINNTVSVMGEVYRPLDIMYEKGKSINSYIANAGGVTRLANRSRTFVIYPNGSSAKINKVLGIFPNNPRVEPGSKIFVPQKPKRQGLDVAKAGIFVSALTALVYGLSLILK